MSGNQGCTLLRIASFGLRVANQSLNWVLQSPLGFKKASGILSELSGYHPLFYILFLRISMDIGWLSLLSGGSTQLTLYPRCRYSFILISRYPLKPVHRSQNIFVARSESLELLLDSDFHLSCKQFSSFLALQAKISRFLEGQWARFLHF